MQHRTPYACEGHKNKVGQILTDNHLTNVREQIIL